MTYTGNIAKSLSINVYWTDSMKLCSIQTQSHNIIKPMNSFSFLIKTSHSSKKKKNNYLMFDPMAFIFTFFSKQRLP